MQPKYPDRLTLFAFVVMVLFAGLNPIGIRYLVAELPPFWGATIRFAPASLLLFLFVLILRLPIPKGRALLGAVVYGALNIGIAFALAFWSLQTISAGLGAVLLALTPLLTLLFAILHRQEKFRWKALFGALLAVVGIAVIYADQLSSQLIILPLIAILLAAAAFAEAGVIIKAFPKSHPVTTNAIGMAAGTILLFVFSLISGEPRFLPSQLETWIALIYLILIGSCVVFILALYILKRWTASAASYNFVLMPFVTIFVSAWLGQETLTLTYLAGGVLVLLGVYVGALRKSGQTLKIESLPDSLDIEPLSEADRLSESHNG